MYEPDPPPPLNRSPVTLSSFKPRRGGVADGCLVSVWLCQEPDLPCLPPKRDRLASQPQEYQGCVPNGHQEQ